MNNEQMSPVTRSVPYPPELPGRRTWTPPSGRPPAPGIRPTESDSRQPASPPEPRQGLNHRRQKYQREEQIQEDPEFSYTGYQVVRGEFFSHMNEPCMSFSDGKITFNTACLRKAPDVDYVLALVNKEEKKLVIRPSHEDVKDSFPWRSASSKAKQITCRIFSAMVTSLMNWDPSCRYKMIGKMIRSKGELLFVFDLTCAEMFPRQTVIDKNGQEKIRTSRKPVFPEDWKDQFGLPVDEHEKRLQINIFDGYAVFAVRDRAKAKSAEPVQDQEVNT